MYYTPTNEMLELWIRGFQPLSSMKPWYQIPEVIALIQFNVGIMNSRVPTIELNKFMELNPSIEATIPDS